MLPLYEVAREKIKEYEQEREKLEEHEREAYFMLTGKIWGLREFFFLEDEVDKDEL